jgi:hypothetical protein
LIEHVDYDLEIMYKINCDDFEKQFRNNMFTRLVTNRSEINRFLVFERKLKPNKKAYFPDVRAKIIIYKDNGMQDTLCLDGRNNASLNGTPMLISEEFVAFIRKIE